jgi:hypothetical protein
MTSWLQHRQEDVADAQRLVAQLQADASPAEMLKVQQDWVAGVFQRMNAEAIAFQASAMQMVEKSMHCHGGNGETANDTTTPHAAQHAADLKPVPAMPKAR